MPITTAILGGSSSIMVAQAMVQKLTLPCTLAPTTTTGSPIMGSVLPNVILDICIAWTLRCSNIKGGEEVIDLGSECTTHKYCHAKT